MYETATFLVYRCVVLFSTVEFAAYGIWTRDKRFGGCT